MPDDRMLSEEEIMRLWKETRPPITPENMDGFLMKHVPAFARRIESLVRERIAEMLEQDTENMQGWKGSAFREAARLV